MNGYHITQKSVYDCYLWKKWKYWRFWSYLLMWARPIENIVNIKGTPCVLPAHTVYIPEYNYGILELTRQDVRTLLKKMVQSGYIAVNTKSKRTYITILESELYKYPQIKKNTTARASKTEPEKPAQTSEDFNFILNKIN